jgi:hypothetical protein
MASTGAPATSGRASTCSLNARFVARSRISGAPETPSQDPASAAAVKHGRQTVSNGTGVPVFFSAAAHASQMRAYSVPRPVNQWW